MRYVLYIQVFEKAFDKVPTIKNQYLNFKIFT